MNNNLLKMAIIVIILANNLYAGNPVAPSKNGITVAARAISSQECKTLFGQDLHSSRIYPICFSIHNDKNCPIRVSIKDIAVSGAHVLTKSSIQSSISAMYVMGCVFIFLCFPLSFLIYYNIKQLTQLLAIVAKHSFSDEMVKIGPGETFEMLAFPEYRLPETEYPKDANGNRLRDEHGKEVPGKTPAFIAPQFVDAAVTFATDTAWFRFTLEFSVPV